MPQPNKKRGRRMSGKKRKLDGDLDDDAGLAESSAKRRKSSAEDFGGGGEGVDFITDVTGDESLAAAYPPLDKAFFGVLDEQEQEYFKNADAILEANDFPDPEQRDLFLANVYCEADGKELKIAQSQSCSRLMERLIQLSSPSQLKNLFQKFSGKYVALASHSQSSEC
jgi:hypothetical protein